jgi:hypothetical protein
MRLQNINHKQDMPGIKKAASNDAAENFTGLLLS